MLHAFKKYIELFIKKWMDCLLKKKKKCFDLKSHKTDQAEQNKSRGLVS